MIPLPKPRSLHLAGGHGDSIPPMGLDPSDLTEQTRTAMTERGGTADEAWTLASFSDTIHRGGVALWAWSPVRRLARLDSLCQEFWGTTQTVIGIDELFAKVNLEDRLG